MRALKIRQAQSTRPVDFCALHACLCACVRFPSCCRPISGHAQTQQLRLLQDRPCPSTSQRMELIAAIRGLEALHNPSTVYVFSDSQYLVRGMSQWIHGWIRNDRLDTPDALANQDLWKQLAALASKHKITWDWVRGHAGHPFNERCDKLAKRAAEEGMRATEATSQPKGTVVKEEALPLPVAQVTLEPVPLREDSEFDADEDGQLKLC